jgi:hypothetical protein
MFLTTRTVCSGVVQEPYPMFQPYQNDRNQFFGLSDDDLIYFGEDTTIFGGGSL